MFSVNSEREAGTLINLAGSLGWGNKRMAVPDILREEMANMPAVAEHLDRWYKRISKD